MTSEAAFLSIAIGIVITMITTLVLYKFRYVIRSGYFRAEILLENGQYLTRTFRLKNSREFTIMVEGVLDTYHILDGRSEIMGKEIVERPNRVYHGGRMRLPKSYYNAHQSEPIDMQNLRKQSEVSATRYRELARNTVTSGLLDAFKETSIREAMEKLIYVLIPLAGILVLGYFLNSKLESILDRI